MKQKGRGHNTKADIEHRRSKVLALYLRGLSSDEIAQVLESEGTGISRITVYRDIQALEQSFKVELQDSRRFLRNKALVELNLLWREAWMVYYQPPVDNRDPAYRKLAALHRLVQIWEMRARASGLTGEAIEELSREDTKREIIGNFINSIKDTELRHALLNYVKEHRTEIR